MPPPPPPPGAAWCGRLNATLAGGITGAFPAARIDLQCAVAAALAAAGAGGGGRLRAGLAGQAAAGMPRPAARWRARTAPTCCSPMRRRACPPGCARTGEQKALLVAVVLAHAALIAGARGFAPLLLLDEVAAHLDAPRREALFAALAALPAQAFLTGTDAAIFHPLAGIAEAFRASPGQILPDADLPVPRSPVNPYIQSSIPKR